MSDLPPDYSRPTGPPGTVEIEDESDADDSDYEEEDTTEWGVQAQVAFSPAQLESLLRLGGAYVGCAVGAVLTTALVTHWLL